MSEQINIDMSLITCPNCQAQYKVGLETLGKDGRMVKCAQCQSDWMARPKVEVAPKENPSDLESNLVDEAAEKQLDQGFASGSEQVVQPNQDAEPAGSNIVAGPGMDMDQEVDAQTLARQRKDMAKRQSLLIRRMPKARFQRAMRLAGVIILALLIVGGVLFRENVVRTFPDLAGVYSSIGLGVNVFGLEFSNVQTLVSLKNGIEVIDISASISSVSAHQVSVPPVIVTLLDGEGNSLYEWSVTARAAIMLPGEIIDLDTHLASPPPNIKTVRLTFEGLK